MTDREQLDQRLWSLSRHGDHVEARVRTIPDVGVELRFLWNGDLHESRLFKRADDPALRERAEEKRLELALKGWT